MSASPEDLSPAETKRRQAETYNAFFVANQPHAHAIYNEPGMDPRHIAEQIDTFPKDQSRSIEEHVTQWHQAQPHPRNPALTVAEFPMAVKMATRTKFGGHATAAEAGAFWQEFQGANEKLQKQGKDPMSPHEYTSLVDQMAPVSAALHGRPPSMDEVTKLREASPAEQRKYFEDLPDPLYPVVSAGQMAKYMTLGNFHAKYGVGRPAAKSEAAYFAVGGMSPTQVQDYYRNMAPVQHPVGAPAKPAATPPAPAAKPGAAAPGPKTQPITPAPGGSNGHRNTSY